MVFHVHCIFSPGHKRYTQQELHKKKKRRNSILNIKYVFFSFEIWCNIATLRHDNSNMNIQLNFDCETNDKCNVRKTYQIQSVKQILIGTIIIVFLFRFLIHDFHITQRSCKQYRFHLDMQCNEFKALQNSPHLFLFCNYNKLTSKQDRTRPNFLTHITP